MAIWGALMKHTSWQELCKLCDENVAAVAGDVLQPVRKKDEELFKNVQRGHIQGVQYVLGLPQRLFEQAEVEFRRLQQRGDEDEPEVVGSQVP